MLSLGLALSDRESEVIWLVAQEFSNNFAARIPLSIKTAETYNSAKSGRFAERLRSRKRRLAKFCEMLTVIKAAAGPSRDH
jgi:hypothetical protein